MTAPRAPVLAVAALGGAGTMVVELAAVRVLSPWFGASAVVWTNVIGVVLFSLALGYLLGAHLARGASPLGRLALVLGLAAAASAWVPALAAPVGELFMPAGVPLHEAAALLAWGSLAASLVLFLPPALALGCVAPLAVEAVQRRSGDPAGTAGGVVLGCSTAGSLAGAFGTSLWLVPTLGLTGTFRTASAALAAAALLSALLARSSARRAALPALLVAAAALGWGLAGVRRPPVPEGRVLLAAEESRYQSVRVVEDPALGLRFLQVNELTDSYQSVWQPEPGLLPEGYYYNGFALPAAWSLAGAEPAHDEWSVLVLGLGAGTAWRVLEGTLPPGVDLDSDGVELDPAVVRLARRELGLPTDDPSRRVHVGDARTFLASGAAGTYDQIVLDTYANQIEIPPHVSSVEFFRELRAHLRPGGWLSVNVGSFDLADPVLEALARTIAAAFEAPVLALPIPLARNHVLLARADARLPDVAAGAPTQPPELGRLLLAPAQLPGALRVFRPTADPPLTDDHNPVRELQRRSVQRARAVLGGAT